jgi:hypothetical protein
VALDRREIEVNRRHYLVEFQRHIVHNQREVTAIAYDSQGVPVRQEVMTTAEARLYLPRDTAAQPATWEELAELAMSNLRLALEELE